MTAEIASVAASLTSVVLGLLAIGLSVAFFKMSSDLSTSTREAARDIGASVDRLESLFDRLYSDTFSMMKDTVSDMRKHIWPQEVGSEDEIAEEADRKADEKVDALRAEMERELLTLLERQSAADAKVETVAEDLRLLVDRAISESRRVEIEARESAIQEKILLGVEALDGRRRSITAAELVGYMKEAWDVDRHKVLDELESMRAAGIAFWEPSGRPRPDSVIQFL